MAAIRAVNINNWYPPDYSGVYVPIIQHEIVPDPSTGSLYGSSTPMQDDWHVFHDVSEIPAAPPVLANIGSFIGMPGT